MSVRHHTLQVTLLFFALSASYACNRRRQRRLAIGYSNKYGSRGKQCATGILANDAIVSEQVYRRDFLHPGLITTLARQVSWCGFVHVLIVTSREALNHGTGFSTQIGIFLFCPAENLLCFVAEVVDNVNVVRPRAKIFRTLTSGFDNGLCKQAYVVLSLSVARTKRRRCEIVRFHVRNSVRSPPYSCLKCTVRREKLFVHRAIGVGRRTASVETSCNQKAAGQRYPGRFQRAFVCAPERFAKRFHSDSSIVIVMGKPKMTHYHKLADNPLFS